MQTDDYEKLVDREVRAALQRIQEAEEAKQQGLRTWRLPESLKVGNTYKQHIHIQNPGCRVCNGCRAECTHSLALTDAAIGLTHMLLVVECLDRDET